MNAGASAPSGVTKTRPTLTPAQRRRVRELMEDEGHTRAEAVAWVLAMEPEGSR